jgi:hypothetical protein
MEHVDVIELGRCETAYLYEFDCDDPFSNGADDEYIVASIEMLQVTRKTWEE